MAFRPHLEEGPHVAREARRFMAVVGTLVVVAFAAAAWTDSAVAAPGADLQVSKSDSPDPVAQSGNISYSIQVYNNPNTAGSGAQADNVSLSDTLPANTTL